MNSNKIIFIVGPTAIGKSDVAVSLAQKINGEIVSCDSMQVYKEISIVTSKPSKQMLQSVPHHLIDVVSVTENFDVATFNQLALAAIQSIHALGKTPVIVGGSGLYMQVLLDGIFEDGEKDLCLRKELKQRANQEGGIALYEELQNADPEAAAKIHPNDIRRVVRALEVFTQNRKPISELQKMRSGLWGKYDIAIYALGQERSVLYQRINERVDNMFDAGLVDEIRQLNGVDLGLTAQRIIGVQEAQSYLRGDCDLVQAKEAMKQNTRRFAKRQLTWFRRDKRLKWVKISPEQDVFDAVQMILEDLQ